MSAGALALQVPIAQLADRTNRTRLALVGAAVWAVFSFATGLAWVLWALAVARAGSGIGKAVVDPTHNSLIADYYEPALRPGVFAFHRAANAIGQIAGPLFAGVLAFYFGWRVPFIVFAVPTLVLVVLGLRMREPVRGAHERRAMGAGEEAIDTEEEPPSYAEAWRMMWKIESLRRIWFALPVLAASLIGFGTFASLLYDEVFDLDERARGFLAAGTEPFAHRRPGDRGDDQRAPHRSRSRVGAALPGRHRVRQRRCPHRVRPRAHGVGGGGCGRRSIADERDVRAVDLRGAVDGDPAPGPVAGLLDRFAVGAARPRGAPVDRRDR